MRTISTLAVTLGFMALTANIGSAQIVTIDKINLSAPPANAPPGTQDTVQPEGKASIAPQPGTWTVVVTFGTLTGGVFTPFPDTTTATFPITAPTPQNGATWKFPGLEYTKATWTAPYYCRAQLKRDYYGISVKSTAHMQVK